MTISDPLRPPVIWGRLVALVDEAAAALVRTAFSTIIREANDYTCMLLDRARLRAGQEFAGPLVAEERESTTVIGPSGRLRIDDRLDLVIDVTAA